MKTLIIDTSSDYCILAIADEERILMSTIFLHENHISRFLLPEISSLLDKSNLSLKQLARIALGVGPGSYTGTRVGAAVAKGLAYGLQIPLRGLCSLALFLPACHGLFASVLPAKSGLFYLLRGEKAEERVETISAGLVSKEELAEQLQSVDFVSARNREELPLFPEEIPFFPFYPLPENGVLALRSAPRFAFETEAQLIYLHAPDAKTI